MRINFRLMAFALLFVSSLFVSPVVAARAVASGPAAGRGQAAAVAQAPAGDSMPACDGVVAVIRIAEITPGGSVEKYLAAVQAQKDWYQKHGMEDLIFASKVLVHDPATNSFSYSTKMVMSYHYYSLKLVPPHDADWDAFVKAFAETSRIKEGPLTCVPREMAPAGAPKG